MNSRNDLDLAVVDVETTGFSPRLHDRIIEIAVVRLSASGERLDEYETLVNPERDVGPTHVHGISAHDICDAPTFGEVAGDVAARLQGAVFIAHNAEFDCRFVAAEYARLGYEIDLAPRLCTMRLAGTAGVSGRRLDACCEECGVSLTAHHSALCDARATAELALTLLGRCGLGAPDAVELFGGQAMSTCAWPSLPTGSRCLTRRESAAGREAASTYVADLVRRLSAAGLGGAAETLPYAELLDRALEDRVVTGDEIDGLHDMALSLGMTAAQVFEAHWRYLEALVAVAWSDGVLTDQEKTDLRHVGALLGLEVEATQALIDSGEAADGAALDDLATQSLAGCTVCFTGQLSRLVDGRPLERNEAEELARAAGIIVKSGVSKKLDILVCADPHSQSGKARKARDYGVRIMAEEAFWRALGV